MDGCNVGYWVLIGDSDAGISSSVSLDLYWMDQVPGVVQHAQQPSLGVGKGEK